ncbi:MAG: deoxyribonuclease IV [Desulfovibrionaceae bacterium]|nr:deoxyribonuclease IV [Desulfovibrionaceae bacterium]
MLHIGCHLSSSKGFLHMVQEALSIGADTFQFFTRNPRGSSKAKKPSAHDIAAASELMQAHAFAPIIAHAPYTLNACSAKPDQLLYARELFAGDLEIMEKLPGNLYNFHPGFHVGQGAEEGIRLIAETLNAVITPGQSTTVLLETMSGKGSEIGSGFEELREIIDRTECQDCIGVCLDTCHVHDAGYPIVEDLDGVLTQFDKVIGLDRLRAVHLNDSKNPRQSHKDRHEKIGKGHIGLEALARVVSHPALRDLPFCLETPNDLDGYAEEIRLLRTYG